MKTTQFLQLGKYLTALAVLTGLTAGATPIAVPNASFETPVTTTFVSLPTAYTTGAWIGYTKFTAVVKGGAYGTRPNGLTGNQFCDLSGEVGGGIFQDCAAYNNSSDPS